MEGWFSSPLKRGYAFEPGRKCRDGFREMFKGRIDRTRSLSDQGKWQESRETPKFLVCMLLVRTENGGGETVGAERVV